MIQDKGKQLRFEQIDQNLKEMRGLNGGKRAVLIHGNTRVGKTTIFLMLQNKTLRIVEDRKQMLVYYEGQTQEVQRIMNEGLHSVTSLPSIRQIELPDTSPLTLVDMPGTKDSNYFNRILNSCYIREATNKMEAIHILIITSVDEDLCLSSQELSMFEEVKNMYPGCREHITIFVNKIPARVDENGLADKLKKRLKEAFVKYDNQKPSGTLRSFYTDILDNKQKLIFFAKRPVSNDVAEKTKRTVQKMKIYFQKMAYLPNSPSEPVVVNPIDLFDSGPIVKNLVASFKKDISKLYEFLSKKIQKLEEKVEEMREKMKENARLSTLVPINIETGMNRRLYFLNMLYYIYAEYEVFKKKQFKTTEETLKRLQQFMNFLYQQLFQFEKVKQAKQSGNRVKSLNSIIQTFNKEIKDIFDLLWASHDEKGKQQIPMFKEFKDRVGAYQKRVKNLIEGDQRGNVNFVDLSQSGKVMSHFNSEKQLFLFEYRDCFKDVTFSTKTHITAIQNQMYHKVNMMEVLRKVYKYIFSEFKNEEEYKKMQTQNWEKKLTDKLQTDKLFLNVILSIMNRKATEAWDIYQNKIKGWNLPKDKMVIFNRWFLSELQKISGYQYVLQLCKELDFRQTPIDIMLDKTKVPREIDNYPYFLQWGNKYKTWKQNHTAVQFYNCCFECLQGAQEQKRQQINQLREEALKS